MAEKFDLIADYRDDKGKGASRRLRREGKVPAIIYGAGRPPRSLSFDHNKVLRQLENESFYSSVLNIKVGDKSQAAIVKDIQRHPAKPQVLHMDFQRIVEDEEIRMNVPIHFMGEKQSPGVRQGGVVSHLMTDVEVVCLPRYLPEYLEIDVSQLELDDMLHLSDLKLPEGVEIPELAQGPEHDQVIVTIAIPREEPTEEELEAEAAEAGEVPVGDEAAADEDEGEREDDKADED
ncbi:MAG: 50S ribosomal protein L25/general stress protein Ctc [Woeseiaceae bacterium]|nr:50S ribosomal protein L25/general stress protein Ctc [Woeseiaceae bacterium]